MGGLLPSKRYLAGPYDQPESYCWPKGPAKYRITYKSAEGDGIFFTLVGNKQTRQSYWPKYIIPQLRLGQIWAFQSKKISLAGPKDHATQKYMGFSILNIS